MGSSRFLAGYSVCSIFRININNDFSLIPSFGENGQFSESFCEFVSKTAGLTPLIRSVNFDGTLVNWIFSGVLNPFLYSFFGNVFLQDLTKAKTNLFRKVPSLGRFFIRGALFFAQEKTRKRATFQKTHAGLRSYEKLSRRVTNRFLKALFLKINLYF